MSENVASILATKARQDFNSAVVLSREDPDEVGEHNVGHKLQQSIELASKSLILSFKRSYEHTHDLRRLFVTISRKIQVPAEFHELEALTPYAGEERYESPISRGNMDWPYFIDLARNFLVWAAEQRDILKRD